MKKIITVILGILLVVLATLMPFHLKSICYNFATHPENSLGSWNAVFLSASAYAFAFVVGIATLVLINVLPLRHKKKKKEIT